MFFEQVCLVLISYLLVRDTNMMGTYDTFVVLCTDMMRNNDILVVPCTDNIGRNDTFGYYLQWYEEKLKTKVLHCVNMKMLLTVLIIRCTDASEIMINFCSFLSLIWWGIMSFSVVFCTNVIGSNDTIFRFLHWNVGENWQFCLFVALHLFGQKTPLFVPYTDMMRIIVTFGCSLLWYDGH